MGIDEPRDVAWPENLVVMNIGCVEYCEIIE